MEPGRGVHAFIQIFFLNVDMAVEMDDADALGCALRNAAHAGEADRMIAANHDWQCAA